ncbi:TetR family transcriptional regulator, partial [Streptomyces alkaliphilus]|uniref:TetR family transcriptional regulator n=1 Tax=Streptomyces alkaliphilus TaxID=1472722 RepID=UPI0015655802
MSKQDRAAMMRALLVEAAAEEFERDGYAGVSLGRVSHAAGLSSGALTFHFRQKTDLADAVVDEARAAVRAPVSEALSVPGTPLDQLSGVVMAVTRVLHEKAVARAAARLELDHSTGLGQWSGAWQPLVRRLAEDASRAGELSAGTRPEDVSALAGLFLRAVALRTAARSAAGHCPDQEGRHPHLAQHLRLWPVVRRGLAAPPPPSA